MRTTWRTRTEGLSPRVRGNPFAHHLADPHRGSIPARAGEPEEAARDVDQVGVYPRACGGTSSWSRTDAWLPGLSPRVRGNLSASPSTEIVKRSIPARAGEPFSI